MNRIANKEWRERFPIFTHSNTIYLDNAATTHKPAEVIDAINDFYSRSYAPVHRATYTAAEQATAHYEQVREAFARYIQAEHAEIVFTAGATQAINIVAQSWARYHIKAGDEILLTRLEHHANIVPWLALAKECQAQIRWIELNQDLTLNIDHLETLITDKTKLVACTLSSNMVGPVPLQTIQQIIRAAHQVGARVLLDAAQLLAHHMINVRALEADFIAFSGHKMFGPTGVGILYINKRVHDDVRPFCLGGGMVDTVSYQDFTSCSLPQMLEAGTPPTAQVIGLGAALKFLETMDRKAQAEYEEQLMQMLIEGLMKLPHITILGSPKLLTKSHIVCFYIKNLHAHDLAAYLDDHGIAVRAGHHCCQPLHKQLGVVGSVRVSIALYTTSKEIETLLALLAQLR